MWYITKLGPATKNAARELEVHMSHLGTEHWKALGHLIGYPKGKETNGTIIRKPKVLKEVIFCDSNYATYKETRKSVSGLVATLGRTILNISSDTQRTVTLISTESEYSTLLACAQEMKFVNMLLEEMTEVHNLLVVYEDNQGAILQANNRKVGMHTNHIAICNHL